MRKFVTTAMVWRLAAAVFASVLALLTLFVPDWIEEIFGVDPDSGDGSLEWLLVGAFVLIALVLFASAWRVYRRLGGPASAAPGL